MRNGLVDRAAQDEVDKLNLNGMKILPNGIAVIDRDTHFTKWIEETGRLDHDWRTLELFKEWIPIGGTVIDVGAFIGDQSRWYLDRVGTTGTVICFEPNREAYQCLIHNCPEALTFQVGVDELFSFRNFHFDDNNIGATSLDHDTGNGGEPGAFCVPIDYLELERLDFMKGDCEGFEMQMLAGARETIERFKPAILLEINTPLLAHNQATPEHIQLYLEHFGYKLHWRNGEGDQYDALYVAK